MSKKTIYEFKLGHGWFKGHKKETDVICTIDSGIAMWHTLILEELADTNKIIEREREREFLSKIIRRWVTRWRVTAMA